jgi:hypothetical protein
LHSNAGEDYTTLKALAAGHAEEKLEGLHRATNSDVDLVKNESLDPDLNTQSFRKLNFPFRPQFTETTTRINTFKQIATSGRGALTMNDIDAYLQGQQVYLTTDELSVLLSVMSSRNQDTVSISEFYKYCPSKGEFAQKVWESIVLCR